MTEAKGGWEDRVSVAPFIPRQCMEQQLCAEPIPDTGDTAEQTEKGYIWVGEDR